MSKKILSMFLVIAMIFTIIPTSVFAEDKTTFELDFDHQITLTQEYEFDYVITPVSADANKEVATVFQFSSPRCIESLYIWDVVGQKWDKLELENDAFVYFHGLNALDAFGKYNSKIKITFKDDCSIGEESLYVGLETADNGTIVEDETIYFYETHFHTVAMPKSTLTTDLVGAQINAGEWYEFSFTLNAISSDVGKKVVAISEFDNADQIEALEYWEVADSSWKPLSLDGTGHYGGANGFEIPVAGVDLTSNFRVKFKETAMIGIYGFTASVMLMDGDIVTDTVVCSTTAEFDVLSPPVPDPSYLTTTINGATVEAGEWYEFDFVLHAKSHDGGKMVIGTSEFSNDDQIEALEYWEGDATTGEWKNLLLDGNGSFGPASGFPMPNADVDVTSKFRVKFKEDATIGEYSFTAQIKLVDGSNTICSTVAQFNVIAPAISSDDATSETTMEDEIVADEWYNFKVTFFGKAADEGKTLLDVFHFGDDFDIVDGFEIFDDGADTWYEIEVDEDGKYSTGESFTMPNADFTKEYQLRLKLKNVDSDKDYIFYYCFSVEDSEDTAGSYGVMRMKTFKIISSTTNPIGNSTLTTDIDGANIPLGEWYEFSFTLDGSAEDVGKKVVGVSQFAETDIIDALEYWEVADNSWHNLLLDGDGKFGADEGFDMPGADFTATSRFRIKLKHPDVIKDSYSFSVDMIVVGDTSVNAKLCGTNATFTIDHSPVMDTSEMKHDETGHWYGATCSCSDKIQYAEHTSSDWIIDVEAKVGVPGSKHKECTVCHRTLETAEIPAKTSSGGGGGSYIRYTNIDVRSDDNEIQYRASISGNSVTISMSNSELSKIINSKIDVGTIVIDLKSANKEIEKATVTNSNLKYMFNAMETTDISGLTIIFEEGSIVLNMDAIEYLLDNNSRNVDFYFVEQTTKDLNTKQKDAIKDMTVLGLYEAYISINNKRVTGFEDGSAVISVDDAILDKYDYHGLGAYVVNTDGEKDDVRVYYRDDIEVVVSDVEDYVIVYDADNLIKTCPKTSKCPLHKYFDMNTYDWYHDGVHYAIDNGLMVGYSNTTFGPNDAITRGQIVTILWRLENSPVVNYLMSFKDVSSGAYYAEAIRWAQAEGIVSGYNDVTFGPDDIITREQMVTIMYRYAEYKNYDLKIDKSASLLAFSDYASVSDWAVDAVKWSVDNGIIAGYGDGILGPLGTTTRAQAATIMYRFCQEFCK